jgi:hypothetical protein
LARRYQERGRELTVNKGEADIQAVGTGMYKIPESIGCSPGKELFFAERTAVKYKHKEKRYKGM